MSIDNADDVLPGPPNAGAYEEQELRSGPPLSYVAEKFRHCLEGLHGAICKMEAAAKGGRLARFGLSAMTAANRPSAPAIEGRRWGQSGFRH